MKIIDQTIEKIMFLKDGDSAFTLAQCLLSACSSKFKAPSFLDISANLDTNNKELIKRLLDITNEPDYSNADQELAISWLQKSYFADELGITAD